MSADLTGADLGDLDALADAYAAAGSRIAGRADELRTRLGAAVATFEATMVRLHQETTTLTQALDDEVATVASQSGAVAWSGANRSAFDADLQRFVGAVRAGSAAIVAGVGELRASIDQRFSPILHDVGRAVTGAAAGVDAATGDLRVGLATLRTNLDHAANVGWTSA